MKIGIVTTYTNAKGGVQIFTKDLSNLLQERGHDVHVFGIDSLSRLPIKGKEEETVGEAFNNLNKIENYDVVICNGEFGYKVNHPRAINIFHGNYKGYAESVSRLVPKELTADRLRKAKMQKKSAEGKYVITVSNFAIKGLEETGINVDKVINNSTEIVSIPDFYGVGNHALSLSRGRYYEKGLDLLNLIAEKGIEIRLFSDSSINSPNIDNRELLDQDRIKDEYQKASATLHLSRFEGGSLVTLEALSTGCPLITTPVGYGLDIAKKIPEFVVNLPFDIDEFMEKFQKITSNRDTFGKKGMDYFLENHHPEKFRKEWISVVENFK